MNSRANLITGFFLGAAAGSLVAWKVLKTKYEQLAQREIDSYKEAVKERGMHIMRSTGAEEVKILTTLEDQPMDTDTEEKDELTGILDTYRSNDRRGEVKKEVSKPYIITNEDFDDHADDYDCQSLTYYACGTLTDEWDHVIKNVDDIVGEGTLDHFETSKVDSIYVRNDELRCDYEILRDMQTFAEAMGADYDITDAED